MATVKVKFRPSTVDGEQGIIFYQVIHNRVARQQKSGYRLYGYDMSGTATCRRWYCHDLAMKENVICRK